ncbi:hypothetical protein EDC96DRAFT_492592 [Choanephora cucurbitarum]|nr:hypothetical protein EDC96DRAFT_492592 [Choanephora cucurbitarum]
MASYTIQQTDMPNLIHRLKLRLALANFKREHGYEHIDLRTLESSLYEHRLKKSLPAIIEEDSHPKKKRKLISEHPFYPFTSPPNHSFRKKLSGNTDARLHYDQRKISLSSDDEDAAHLLVMMHQSPTMSS